MEHHAADRATTRPVVAGTEGLVSAGHPLVSMAGMRMLLARGNAFDAAVAAGFAAAVVEPTASYTLCGECVALIHDARRREVLALSGQGIPPALATIEFFRRRGLDRIPTGPGPDAHLSFTVPGAVDAYLTLLETRGTKRVREVLAPAIQYAAHGFPMYQYMQRLLAIPDTRTQFERYPPGGTAVFYPEGRVPEVGERFVQPALARTLRRLADADGEGSSRDAGIAAARERFYRGDIATQIGAFSERVGGLLRAGDLAGYRARLEPPLRMSFHGREVLGQSTWTQGPVLLQALGILETFDLREMGHNSTRYIHVVVEALKLAFADRERYYGDTDAAPIAELLAPAYARERAALIRLDRATLDAPPPGDPRAGAPTVGAIPRAPARGASLDAAAADGTTHIAAIDREGNMICLTPSGGVFRKSAFMPELGCTLSTRSEMFVLEDGHPNALGPGKRPRTTLVSYLICEGGVPTTTIGCPGGDDQAQADLQLILNVLVFGMDPQQAVEAPRFSTQTLVNSFYPRVYQPGQLNVEPGIPERVRAELGALGHAPTEVGACGIGAVVMHRDPESGVLSAGADPRRPTYALAW
jgi:gamma-glutamyltranspeptidase/glutathione hydrolase